ncbi:hypothetical protein Sjap_014870 [Stephania japonica]|uniref:Uncharacterized protein n=1 Tax=Stephania japonica TaxID=461633 RepID=A0AAP0IJ53_9MAGN
MERGDRQSALLHGEGESPERREGEEWERKGEASRLYAASWVRDIGRDLRPNDCKKYKDEDKTHEVNSTAKEKVPSSLEDLGGQLLNFIP